MRFYRNIENMNDQQFNKGCGYIFAAVVIFFCIGVIISQLSSTSQNFEQIEYYRGDDKFRVFVYVAPHATIEEIKEHALSQMWTEGKRTEVLYYRSNPFIHSGSVTMSSSFIEAYKKAVMKGCILRCQIDNFGNKYFSETPYEDRLKALEEEKLMEKQKQKKRK